MAQDFPKEMKTIDDASFSDTFDPYLAIASLLKSSVKPLDLSMGI